eukprot:GSChrysophyteH2.ASY1.ANO1.1285.1 assembled CDS
MPPKEEQATQWVLYCSMPGENKGVPRVSTFLPKRTTYSVIHHNDADSVNAGVELQELELNDLINPGWREEIAATVPTLNLATSPEADLLNKSSWLSCYINLTSTILGAGMLGLPYAFSEMGWILGTVLLIVCAAFALLALFFLAKCAKKTAPPSSFHKVAQLATPGWAFLIDCVVAVKCFGVATSYLVVVGDLMPLAMLHIAPNSFKLLDRNLWVGIGFLVVAPLSCLRSLDALRWTSGFSGIFLVFLVSLVVAYALPDTTGLDPCATCEDSMDIVTASIHVMPIFIFGYACQQNSFGIVNELENPSIQRINSVFLASISSAVVIYIIMASAGYLAFGNTVKPNILVSYPNNSFTSAARIFVSLVVLFHYPLQAHPARKSMLSLISSFYEETAEPNKSVYYQRYAACMILFLGLSIVIALSVTDLGLMLSLVGATGSTAISYILPGIFYYKIYKNEGPAWLQKLSWYQYIIGIFLVPFSLVAIFVVKTGKGEMG